MNEQADRLTLNIGYGDDVEVFPGDPGEMDFDLPFDRSRFSLDRGQVDQLITYLTKWRKENPHPHAAHPPDDTIRGPETF